MYGRNVMSTSLLEVSLLGVGTVLRLERDAWSMVKRLRQATNEYAPPLPVSLLFRLHRFSLVYLFAPSFLRRLLPSSSFLFRVPPYRSPGAHLSSG